MLTSDSIVGPGGWFVNLSRGFSSTNSHLFSCCCFWWWWLVIFLQGVLKKGLTEFWGLCWEAIFWAKVVISGHVHTLKIIGSIMRLKDGLPRKNCCSFAFCPNEGGEGPAQFFGTFSWVPFWSIQGVYFLQNTNNFKIRLFLGCIHDPQSKYSAFI